MIEFTVKITCDKCGKSEDKQVEMIPLVGPDYSFQLIQDIRYWKINRHPAKRPNTYCPACASNMYF